MSIKCVLYAAHPALPTGYARVVRELLKRLDGDPALGIVVYGIQNKGGELAGPYSSVRVHDSLAHEAADSSGFGMHEFADFVRAEAPDVVLLYNDLYVVSHLLRVLQPVRAELPALRVVAYQDIFYRNFYLTYLPGLEEQVDELLVFSHCWERHLRDLGVTKPVSVLRHGFDADAFPEVSKREARERLGLSQSAYVILNWNRNLVRKRIDTFVMAVAEVLVRHPDRELLALVNCGQEAGFDVYDILQHELRDRGLASADVQAKLDCVKVTDRPVSEETVNLVYRAADVGVNTCEGEGFGLCSFEHAGLGVPQVVAAVGGNADIFDDSCAVLVRPRVRYYLDRLNRDAIGGMAEVSDPADVAAGIEYYMRNPGIAATHGARAAEVVRAHDWGAIASKLRGILCEPRV